MRSDSVRFGLKTKLIVFSVLLTVVMTLLVTLSIYQVVNRQLFNELRSKVLATVKIGADAIDRQRMGHLVALTKPDLPKEDMARLEDSADYRALSDELNRIRDTDPTVIRYVYTFIPTEDPNTTLFVVDADVLDQLASRAKGEKIDDSEISQIGTTFDVTDYEKAREAIKGKTPTLDDKYVWDDVYKVNSITGYAPILDGAGNLLAVMGIDMADVNARAALGDVTRLSLIIAGAAVLLGLLASIFLGIYMTRDVIALRKTVVSYGQGDFSARSSITSRDEVGSLARSFNAMIETITGYQEKLVAAEREKATAELASKVEGARNAENRKYLDNISQGLLMLDENLRIGEQYSLISGAAVPILGEPRRAGPSGLRLPRCGEECGGAQRAHFVPGHPDEQQDRGPGHARRNQPHEGSGASSLRRQRDLRGRAVSAHPSGGRGREHHGHVRGQVRYPRRSRGS